MIVPGVIICDLSSIHHSSSTLVIINLTIASKLLIVRTQKQVYNDVTQLLKQKETVWSIPVLEEPWVGLRRIFQLWPASHSSSWDCCWTILDPHRKLSILRHRPPRRSRLRSAVAWSHVPRQVPFPALVVRATCWTRQSHFVTIHPRVGRWNRRHLRSVPVICYQYCSCFQALRIHWRQ